MKIVYVANIRIPTEKAHGFQIMKMCESFSLADTRVDLLVPTRKNKFLADQDPFDYYQVKRRFTIKKLFTPDPRWLLKFPAGSYIKAQGAFFVWSLWRYLRRLRDDNKDDIFFYTRDEYLLPFLQRFSSRVVWECHALPNKKKFYKKYFQNCHKILVLTSVLKQQLVDLGIGEEKIMVTPDAVDLEIFGITLNKRSARNKLGLPVDKIILGYTGSFRTKNMDKGIKDIFRAIKILGRNDILFVAIGGEAKDLKYYQQIAQTEGVATQVLLLSRVTQCQLAIYQQAFDILLMPFPNLEHYRYFMSPMKMFEYMAAQRPIIASDLPTIREVLNDSNCVFCHPDDPQDLADKISQILVDDKLVNQISTQAYNDVKNYTWVKRAENILAQCYG